MRSHRRPFHHAAAALAGAAGFACASTPALAIAEAVQSICPTLGTTVVCPWYTGTVGPLVTQILPPEQRILDGSRTIIGLVDGYFPLSTHEAFQDGNGGSRILLEIAAGAGAGGGSPSEIELRTRATGVLSAAAGDGNPTAPQDVRRLTQGIARSAGLYTASVALAPAEQNQFVLNNQGLMASVLLMTDPATGAALPQANGGPITEQADVVVAPFSLVGDWEGEGFASKLFDGVANMFDVTLVAAAGDYGEGPFPPNQPDLEFRTVGAPASAHNVISVAAFDTVEEDVDYITAAAFTSKGNADSRDWRARDPQAPSGFATVENSRVAVHIAAPGAKLRLATATADTEYSRGPTFPTDPKTPPTDQGSQGTAFAAGIIGGAVALLQDAYKAFLPQVDPRDPLGRTFAQRWGNRPRLPSVVTRAIILNSTEPSGLWTNSGNQGANSADPEPESNQPLDTTEGAGQIQLNLLFQNFQGRDASFSFPEFPATLDADITDPTRATIRDPDSVRGADGMAMQANGGGGSNDGGGAGGDPPFGGFGSDPPFEGGSFPPLPPGTFDLPGDFRPRPRDPRLPNPPGAVTIPGAVSVNSFGWDHARIGVGFIDYAFRQPVTNRSSLFATLVWNRNVRFRVPNLNAGATLAFPRDETTLEFENLDLETYLGDGAGNPRLLIADSFSTWGNIEHTFLENVGFTGQIVLRVRWERELYDVYDNTFVSDTPYGIAWRSDPSFNFSPEPSVPGPEANAPGDINRDGRVDNADLSILLGSFGRYDATADINSDGVVNFDDLSIVLGNFGVQAE